MRDVLRVVAAEGLRVRMADEHGQIVRHKLITSQGLYDERTRSTTPGPVEVSATRYITRLVEAKNLIEVKPAAPAPAPAATSPAKTETKPNAEALRKPRGRAEE